MKDDKYMRILAINVSSIFQGFDSFLRTEVDLVVEVIRLVLGEYNSSSTTYETTPGIYTSKDFSIDLSSFLQSEYEGYHNAIDIEFDDTTKKKINWLKDRVL